MSKPTKVRKGASTQVPTKTGDRNYIPDNSVGTAKLENLAVTGPKLGAEAVSQDKLTAEVISMMLQGNLIDNPEGLLFQRSNPSSPTTFNDDTYGPDRWNLLCSANGVSASRSTTAPADARYSILLSKATATGFFGTCQIKEANDSIPLRNKEVTFTVALRTTSLAISQVRVAILGWTGTADSVTSDVVSSWAAIPTYAANVVEYGSQTLNLSDTFQEVSVTATVGGTCNNLILFIHTTNSQGIGDELRISAARAYANPTTLPYIRRNDQAEQARCFRYFEKSYNIDTTPGTAGFAGGFTDHAWVATTVSKFLYVPFKSRKRVTPTVVMYSPQTLNAPNLVNLGGVDRTAATDVIGENSFNGGTTDTNSASQMNFHWTADAEL